jgi:polysaccharide deacetylase family protein (PEP-CTERM system associated)
MRQELKFGPPVISVDIEDWPQSTWDRSLPISQRAENNTRRIVSLMQRANIRATVFVLGKFAEAFPGIVREMRDAGHEVASHGYGHVEVFRQTAEEFREDVSRSKKLLEDILGEPVMGYRAPDFSIVERTLYALDILAEVGFEYDSSIFPIRHSRYGIPDWPAAPRHVRLPSGRTIVEVPIATFRWLDRNWPIGGGGYHRLLPGVVSRHLAKRVMSSTPFTFYCHPYELDARELKEIAVRIPLLLRLHQGMGRRFFPKRFTSFLDAFGGQRVKDLLVHNPWPEYDRAQFATTHGLPAAS